MSLKRSMIVLLSLALGAALADSASGQRLVAGQVVDVIDGRTVVIELRSGRVYGQLQYIDVPAPGEEQADTVKNHLRNLLVGKAVEYRPKIMLADRTIGRLTLQDTDVSQQMLRDGAAWHLEGQGQDVNEYQSYQSMETAAKGEKRGIWSSPVPKSGLEARLQRGAAATQKVSAESMPIKPASPDAAVAKRTGKWGDVNPALGDVGALVNGYNKETRTGYLSTSKMGVAQMDKSVADDQRMDIDFTYVYQEDPVKGRTGTFHMTVMSVAKRWRYAGKTDLTFLDDPKGRVIAKAKRTTYIDANNFHWEQLRYELSRKAMEEIVNGGGERLHIGGGYIEPRVGVQMLLYNMVQLSK